MVDAHIDQKLCRKTSVDHAEIVSMVFLKSKIIGEVHQQMLPTCISMRDDPVEMIARVFFPEFL